jgi:hypothetical protein
LKGHQDDVIVEYEYHFDIWGELNVLADVNVKAKMTEIITFITT